MLLLIATTPANGFDSDDHNQSSSSHLVPRLSIETLGDMAMDESARCCGFLLGINNSAGLYPHQGNGVLL